MKKFNFKNLNLKIVEKFKYFGVFALVLIIAGVIVMSTLGLNVGLDFAGGVKMEVNVGYLTETSSGNEAKTQIEKILTDTVKTNGFDLSYIRWSETDEGNVAEVGLNYRRNGEKIDANNVDAQNAFTAAIQGNPDDETTLDDALTRKIEDAIFKYNPEIETNIGVRIVNASTFTRLLKNSIIATCVAIVAILIYIAIRFTFASGLAAIIALAHDVLVMIALTTFFQVEVNTTFIAAIITIVGYSINATIVVFDRIREIQKLDSMKNASDTEIANMAIRDTLSRSILTTITTLVTIIALAVVCAVTGVSSMQEFALPIIFGLIAGTYSSILLSAPVWVMLRKLGVKMFGKSRK